MCPIQLNDNTNTITEVNFNGTAMSNVYYVKPDGTQILLFASALQAPTISFVSKTYNSISIQALPNNYLPHTLKLDVRSNGVSVYSTYAIMMANTPHQFNITGLESNTSYDIIVWAWTLLQGDGPSDKATYTTAEQLSPSPTITSYSAYYNKIFFTIRNNDSIRANFKVWLYDTNNNQKFYAEYLSIGVYPASFSDTILGIGNPDSTVTYYLKTQSQSIDGKGWSTIASQTIITPKQTVTTVPNIGTITPGIAIIQATITNADTKNSTLSCRILKADGTTVVSSKTNTGDISGQGFITGQGTTFIFTSTDGIDKNTKYYIQASAIASDGEYKVSPWTGGTSYSTTTLDYPTTTAPSIGTITTSYTTASAVIKNEHSDAATIYYYVDDNKQLESSYLGAGGTVTANFSGFTKNTSHTIYAYALATSSYESSIVSKVFTTSDYPTMSTPTITVTSNNYTSVTWTVKNNTATSATIYTTLGDNTEKTSSVGANAGIAFTQTGLTKNTTYTIYAHTAADYYYESSVQTASVTTPNWPTLNAPSLTLYSATTSSLYWTVKNNHSAYATIYYKLSNTTTWSSVGLSAGATSVIGSTGLTYNTSYTMSAYADSVTNYYKSSTTTNSQTTPDLPAATAPTITASGIAKTNIKYFLTNKDSSTATIVSYIVLKSTGAIIASSTNSNTLDAGAQTSIITSPTLSSKTTYIVKAYATGVTNKKNSAITTWEVTTL